MGSGIGMGCMGLSTVDKPTAATLVASAIDHGITLFDTADYYGQGAAEEALGAALPRSARERIVVATKTGIVHGARRASLNGSPEHIRAACEGSLARLGVERIGLYYLARIDPAVPVEESVGALADLVHEGKVERIGLSEVAPSTLRRACAVHPIAAVQSEYSLFERHVEDGVLPACTERGIPLVAYRPLTLGLLTDTRAVLEHLQPDDWRHRDPRHGPAALAQNHRTAASLVAAARERGLTAAALALRWLKSGPHRVVPIPGMRSEEHVADSVGAVGGRLSDSEWHFLAGLFPQGCAVGDRYLRPMLDMVDVEPTEVG